MSGQSITKPPDLLKYLNTEHRNGNKIQDAPRIIMDDSRTPNLEPPPYPSNLLLSTDDRQEAHTARDGPTGALKQ